MQRNRRSEDVEVIGFEPTTSWLQTRRSAELSYTPWTGTSCHHVARRETQSTPVNRTAGQPASDGSVDQAGRCGRVTGTGKQG